MSYILCLDPDGTYFKETNPSDCLDKWTKNINEAIVFSTYNEAAAERLEHVQDELGLVIK